MLPRRATLGLAALPLLAQGARAQAAWPAARPIEVHVGFSAGGGVDVMARAVAPFLSNLLPGARFVVVNRPGAGGQLGHEAAANAAADGYALGATTMPGLVSHPIERNVRYRVTDLTYLANVVDDPCALFVRPESPYRTLADLTKAGVPVFAWGNFVTVAVNFAILAFIIFLMVRQINKLKRSQAEPAAAAPTAPPEDIVLLREIRDSLKKDL